MLYYRFERRTFKVIFHELTFATLMCSDPKLAVPGVGVEMRSPPSSSNCKLFQHGNLTGATGKGVFVVGGFLFFPICAFLRFNFSCFQRGTGCRRQSEKKLEQQPPQGHLRGCKVWGPILASREISL